MTTDNTDDKAPGEKNQPEDYETKETKEEQQANKKADAAATLSFARAMQRAYRGKRDPFEKKLNVAPHERTDPRTKEMGDETRRNLEDWRLIDRGTKSWKEEALDKVFRDLVDGRASESPGAVLPAVAEITKNEETLKKFVSLLAANARLDVFEAYANGGEFTDTTRRDKRIAPDLWALMSILSAIASGVSAARIRREGMDYGRSILQVTRCEQTAAASLKELFENLKAYAESKE